MEEVEAQIVGGAAANVPGGVATSCPSVFKSVFGEVSDEDLACGEYADVVAYRGGESQAASAVCPEGKVSARAVLQRQARSHSDSGTRVGIGPQAEDGREDLAVVEGVLRVRARACEKTLAGEGAAESGEVLVVPVGDAACPDGELVALIDFVLIEQAKVGAVLPGPI